MRATVSDPQYDTEFWFDAAGYTVLDWKGNFSSEAEARKAFDAWLNSIRAEAWDAAASSMVYDDGTPVVVVRNANPYREGAE